MIKLSSLTNHRLHLAGKFFVPDFRNKQEELDIHAPQGALKKTNNNGERQMSKLVDKDKIFNDRFKFLRRDLIEAISKLKEKY